MWHLDIDIDIDIILNELNITKVISCIDALTIRNK